MIRKKWVAWSFYSGKRPVDNMKMQPDLGSRLLDLWLQSGSCQSRGCFSWTRPWWFILGQVSHATSRQVLCSKKQTDKHLSGLAEVAPTEMHSNNFRLKEGGGCFKQGEKGHNTSAWKTLTASGYKTTIPALKWGYEQSDIQEYTRFGLIWRLMYSFENSSG